MTKVAICDSTHFEVVYTIISLFEQRDSTLTIFIDSEAYEQLRYLLGAKTDQFTWFIRNKEESNRKFISRMFTEIRNGSFDLLYFSTVADNFILYAYHLQKLKTGKKIMTLHDINGFFRYNPAAGFRSLIRYAGKRKLIRMMPAFHVLSEGLADHLRSKLKNKKPILVIPGSHFEPPSFIGKEYREGECIKIAIPGSIDQRRRDYQAVFELLEASRQFNIPVSITLLGSFNPQYGEKIKQQCLQYSRTKNNLYTYDKKIVPQAEFDYIMRHAHFIWIPLHHSVTINDGIAEEYGVSIYSGNYGDAIRYARPFFASGTQTMETALSKSCQRYEQVSDIVSALQNLNPESYGHMQQQALQASLHYTKGQIIGRNASFFKSLSLDTSIPG